MFLQGYTRYFAEAIDCIWKHNIITWSLSEPENVTKWTHHTIFHTQSNSIYKHACMLAKMGLLL